MSDSVDPVDRLFLPPTHGRVTQAQQSDKDKPKKSAKDPEEQFEEELEKKKRHGKVDLVQLAGDAGTPDGQNPSGDQKPEGDAAEDKQPEDEAPPPPSHVDVKA